MQIAGKRVVLRDRRESDTEDHFRWMNSEELRYYDEPHKPFKGMTREGFDKWWRQPSRPGSRRWEIDTVEGEHIGYLNCYHLDEEAGIAHVGIGLDEDEWGKGFGTEALDLLIAYLFRERGLRKVRLDTWTGNRRMVRCAEKCGFKEVGRGPGNVPKTVRGEPLERLHFSISRSDWLKR